MNRRKPGNWQPHQCQGCGQRFAEARDLREHHAEQAERTAAQQAEQDAMDIFGNYHDAGDQWSES